MRDGEEIDKVCDKAILPAQHEITTDNQPSRSLQNAKLRCLLTLVVDTS
jgi:hypothetical protein